MERVIARGTNGVREGHGGGWWMSRKRRRTFVGECRSLLRPPGTRGHECLSTVRYDARITPKLRHWDLPFSTLPVSQSLHRANAGGSRS